jgi:hypothetical protein
MKTLHIIPVALILVLAMAGCASAAKNSPGAQIEPEATPQAATETPSLTAESEYDEAWALDQVLPQLKQTLELVRDEEWNKIYDMYPAEEKVGCSRSEFVSKAAGAMLLMKAFGADEILKAELQDIEDGTLPITFSEITPSRITYTVEIGDTPEADVLIFKDGKWQGESKTGNACTDFDVQP